jgi:hypothetical protein
MRGNGWLRIRSRVNSLRKRVGMFISGPRLQDLSMEDRMKMWPAVAGLDDKHIRNCRIVSNREVMLRHMPENSVCAEIGVFTADFSAKILKTTRPSRLHLIDIDQRWTDIAKTRFAEQISRGQVIVHQGDSATIIQNLPDGYFDWVYIDGDHNYQGVKRDLDASHVKLKPGGLLALNDYTFFGPSDFYKYGVMEAVHEFCIAHDFEFIFLALEGRGYHDVVLRQMPTIQP